MLVDDDYLHINQTAYVDPSSDKVYFLAVLCSAECYGRNRGDIEIGDRLLGGDRMSTNGQRNEHRWWIDPRGRGHPSDRPARRPCSGIASSCCSSSASCGSPASPSSGARPCSPLDGPFADAVRIAVNDYWWLLALMALEFVRQVHYFIEERSKGYYRFWQQTVFGGTERRLGAMNDCTRYRVGRAFKFVARSCSCSARCSAASSTPIRSWLGIVEAPARLVGGAALHHPARRSASSS